MNTEKWQCFSPIGIRERHCVTASLVEEIVDARVRSFWLHFPHERVPKPSPFALRIMALCLGCGSAHILAKRNSQSALAVCCARSILFSASLVGVSNTGFHRVHHISGALSRLCQMLYFMSARGKQPETKDGAQYVREARVGAFVRRGRHSVCLLHLELPTFSGLFGTW